MSDSIVGRIATISLSPYILEQGVVIEDHPDGTVTLLGGSRGQFIGLMQHEPAPVPVDSSESPGEGR